jgi:hypothetical protein
MASRNLFHHLPPPAECLAILIGTAELTIFGIAGLASPAGLATGFGIPLLPASSSQKHPGALESSPEESKQATEIRNSQKALIAAIAARNIQNGILLLTFGAWFRDRKTLGLLTILGVVTTATDYVVVKAYGVKEAAGGHLFGVFNCLLVGGSLLWWGRDDPWY